MFILPKNRIYFLIINFIWATTFILFVSYSKKSVVPADQNYINKYAETISGLESGLFNLKSTVEKNDALTEGGKKNIYSAIVQCRNKMKVADFWLRYLEPISQKKINGPLPIEWETEVFEKFERPYKREGYGLTLAELALDEANVNRNTLEKLIQPAIDAIAVYRADSITKNLNGYDHFFLANRLFLLNLAAIYTTGFECPNTENIIPELKVMLKAAEDIYSAYNSSFPQQVISSDYLKLFEKTKKFIDAQSSDIAQFDHFSFIRNFVNPLFSINQQLIRKYNVKSNNYNDFTLNDNVNSIFDKKLYKGQFTKGIYATVTDEKILAEIKNVGKQLFYDPILSGSNERSCFSCHKPSQGFTDTAVATNLAFGRTKSLTRNTPSLLNVIHNHLIMLDGKLTSLQEQAKTVITNPEEMGGTEKDVLEKVLSCKEYKTTFKKIKKQAHLDKEITFYDIISAVIYYYSDFSYFYSPFDEAFNEKDVSITEESKTGFNLFMGKAQCGTCHFVPQFNGVKPPYIGSEFEVVGTPADAKYSSLSDDKGRYNVNPADEMLFAFRTNTLRNATITKPYMHNGVFVTLEEVIDFYDAGGGIGHKLKLNNQTLSADSLRLNVAEKKEILAFIKSLTEKVPVEIPPVSLPLSTNKKLNNRIVGGLY
ncbi:MAG: cytochrome C peroxidase [Bacteroidia bacterium]|nr:cytochrome C peroxidase [Bacteroidia bacterium]